MLSLVLARPAADLRFESGPPVCHLDALLSIVVIHNCLYYRYVDQLGAEAVIRLWNKEKMHVGNNRN